MPISSNFAANPRGSAESGEPQRHWFWERTSEFGSWWEDQFPSVDFDPTAVCVIDGDEPDDRKVLIGAADGYARVWDRSANSDDGEAIASLVLIGPIRPRSAHRQVRFNNFQLTLSEGQGGATMNLYAGDYAETLGAAVDTKVFSAGRSPGWRRAVKGQACWAELVNGTVNTRWSFESLAVDIAPAGRVRV